MTGRRLPVVRFGNVVAFLSAATKRREGVSRLWVQDNSGRRDDSWKKNSMIYTETMCGWRMSPGRTVVHVRVGVFLKLTVLLTSTGEALA